MFYDANHPLIELKGKTLGIIGFGSIGRAVGGIAKAFGMKVLAYNRSESEAGKEVATYVSKDDLFNHSDVISLHIPLTADTKRIINEASIQQMKQGVILFNTARGSLLDEQAVADALNQGSIYAAGVTYYQKSR